MRRSWWCLLIVLLALPLRAEDQGLDPALAGLAQGLAAAAGEAGLTGLGVPELAAPDGTLGGQAGAAGRYLATRLEALLAEQAAGRYQVVPGAALAATLAEDGVTPAELADPVICALLQTRLEGLDGLVVGTLQSDGGQVTIHLELRRLPTAGKLAEASLVRPLDADLLVLLGANLSAEETRGMRPKTAELVEAAVRPPENRVQPQFDRACPFGMEVLFDGRPRPLLQLEGRLVVPVRAGESFKVRLTNNSRERVGVALFIDGLNTVGAQREQPSTGKKWLVEAGKTVVIPGWQLSATESREFVFVGLAESLAMRRHYTDQIGIVTAAFYAEYEPPRVATEEHRGGDLGVGQGRSHESQVEEVPFRAAEAPAAILTLHYDRAAEAPAAP